MGALYYGKNVHLMLYKLRHNMLQFTMTVNLFDFELFHVLK